MCCLYEGKKDESVDYTNTDLRDEDLDNFNNQWDAFALTNTSKALVLFCSINSHFWIGKFIFCLLLGDCLRFSSRQNFIQGMSGVCPFVIKWWHCFHANFFDLIWSMQKSFNKKPDNYVYSAFIVSTRCKYSLSNCLPQDAPDALRKRGEIRD